MVQAAWCVSHVFVYRGLRDVRQTWLACLSSGPNRSNACSNQGARRATLATYMRRFDQAFADILARGEFPSPIKLRRELGHAGSALGGKFSKRRIELLQAHGFIKNERTGRWQPK